MQKILLMIAVITVMGHSILPHHHHEEILLVAHHHDHEEDNGGQSNHHDHDQEQNTKDDHNLFSFAQLDEHFVPVKYQKANIELPILYLITTHIIYQTNLTAEEKKHFGYYREFPPPDNVLNSLPSRAPPILLTV